MSLQLTSSAFTQNGSIPVEHTCEGADTPPPLEWSDIPPETRSLALIVDDPDAPDPAAPKQTYVHWVVYDIPPSVKSLAGTGDLPKGARHGTNDWERAEYGGPCPPIGRHRYFFKLYALDAMLGNLDEPTKADLESAMEGHMVAHAELMGTYEKSAK